MSCPTRNALVPEGVTNLFKVDKDFYAFTKANPTATISEKTKALSKYCTDHNVGYKGFTYLERRLILGKRA